MKLKKIITLALSAIMSISVIGMSVSAAEAIPEEENEQVVVIKDDPIGTVYDLGDGLKIKVIDDDTYEAILDKVNQALMARTKSGSWSLTLQGKTQTKNWTSNSSYPYWNATVNNTQDSGGRITVEVKSPTSYSTITKKAIVYGGNKAVLYLDSEEEYKDHIGTYTMTLNSDSTMSGTATGFLTDYLPEAYLG